MNVTSDIRNRSGYAEVAGVKLNYNWSSRSEEPVTSFRADILKNDQKIGGINVEKDGRIYISFDKEGITAATDQIAIISQAINDAADVFAGKVTVTE